MANTKKLSREERKESKRKARVRLKGLYASMSPTERDKFKQERESKPSLGVKKFPSDARKK